MLFTLLPPLLALAVAVRAAPEGCLPHKNHVENGGFETGDLTDWVTFQDDTGGDISTTSPGYKSNYAAYFLIYPDDQYGNPQNGFFEMYQYFESTKRGHIHNLQEGATYTVSFAYRQSGVNASSTAINYAIGGTSANLQPTHKWQTYTNTFVADATADDIGFGVSTEGGGATFNIDAVSVYRVCS